MSKHAERQPAKFAAMIGSPSCPVDDFPARLHRSLYDKSDDPEHEDNRNDGEFLDGYAEGLTYDKAKKLDAICDEWERRGCPDELTAGFRSWKRGYNAATMRKAWESARSKANGEICNQ